jgi:hypothetical protein
LDVIDQCADIEPFRTADKLGQLLGVIDRTQQDVLRSAARGKPRHQHDGADQIQEEQGDLNVHHAVQDERHRRVT